MSSAAVNETMLRDHVIAFAPGRVNLIGEHTDYNLGLALPFAIDAGVTVEARAIDANRIDAVALDLRASHSFDLEHPRRVRGWRAFVHGTVAELRQAHVPVRGSHLQISGNMPRGAGLSSSAALEVALILALVGLTDAPELDRIQLAKIGSKVENEWVGARTGLLDQLTSLFGESGRALRIDFRSLEVTPVALELDGYRLVTLDSGERRANVASGYNRRRAECARAARRIGVGSLRDATPEQAARLPAPLKQRARHVITENERVEEAVSALRAFDMERLGGLLDASHASLRDRYEVSTAAVEAAVGKLKAGGALGARIVGGGFGGHVLGLLPPGLRVPEGATEVRPGPGARLLDQVAVRRR